MILDENLKKIGLNSYEIEAFMFLAKNGISPARSIHKNTKIPAGKIYSTLKELQEKEFVEVKNSRPKLYFLNDFNKASNKVLLEKQNDFEKNIRSLNTTFDEIKSAIRDSSPKKSDSKRYWFEDVQGDNLNTLTKIIMCTKKKARAFIQIPENEMNFIYLKQLSTILDFISKKDIEFELILNKKNAKFQKIIKEKMCPNIKYKITKKNIQTPYILIDDSISLYFMVNQMNNRIFGIVKIVDDYLTLKLTKYFKEFWNLLK